MAHKKSNSLFIFFFTIIFTSKIIFYNAIDVSFFGAGGDSDANYYADAAEGFADIEFNYWPVLLSFLNKFGLYSRESIKFFLLFLSSIVIPFFVGKLAAKKNGDASRKFFWLAAMIVSLYPVLFFYSADSNVKCNTCNR